MIGPNSTLAHNSMIYMIESHINYVASAVTFLRRPGVRAVEVKAAVQRRYNERLQVAPGPLGLGGGGLRELVSRPPGAQHDAVAGSHLEVPPADPALSSRRVHGPRVGP